MPRLSPDGVRCREERITLGTMERKLLKEYLQHQKQKQFNENLTKITTTTIEGVAMVAASIPYVVGTVAAAWLAKETVTSEQGVAEIKNLGIKFVEFNFKRFFTPWEFFR